LTGGTAGMTAGTVTGPAAGFPASPRAGGISANGEKVYQDVSCV